MITEITGTLIPYRIEQETDVMKIEPDKESPAYWQAYYESLSYGALEFVVSPQMPVINARSMLHRPDKEEARRHFERMGFIVPAIVPAEYEKALEDPLFIIAVLPRGWKKELVYNRTASQQATVQAVVIDENGAPRVRVFIVNSQFERTAHYTLVNRYEIIKEVADTDQGRVFYCHVFDNKTNMAIPGTEQKLELPTHQYVSVPVPDNETFITKMGLFIPENRTYSHGKMLDIEEETQRWLRRNYPEYSNPFAYWDF